MSHFRRYFRGNPRRRWPARSRRVCPQRFLSQASSSRQCPSLFNFTSVCPMIGHNRHWAGLGSTSAMRQIADGGGIEQPGGNSSIIELTLPTLSRRSDSVRRSDSFRGATDALAPRKTALEKEAAFRNRADLITGSLAGLIVFLRGRVCPI